MEEISKAVLDKAFGNTADDHQNGIVYLLQLVDPTRNWSPYARLGFSAKHIFSPISVSLLVMVIRPFV